MKEHYEYKTQGVCSLQIDFDIQDGILKNVVFYRGCNGNTQGIAKLVEGMKAVDAADKLKGIKCNGKSTSCPDQLSQAITKALNK